MTLDRLSWRIDSGARRADLTHRYLSVISKRTVDKENTGKTASHSSTFRRRY